MLQGANAVALPLLQALFKTLYVSGGVAGLDLFVKCIYIYALHVPLFLFGCGQHGASPHHRLCL